MVSSLWVGAKPYSVWEAAPWAPSGREINPKSVLLSKILAPPFPARRRAAMPLTGSLPRRPPRAPARVMGAENMADGQGTRPWIWPSRSARVPYLYYRRAAGAKATDRPSRRPFARKSRLVLLHGPVVLIHRRVHALRHPYADGFHRGGHRRGKG